MDSLFQELKRAREAKRLSIIDVSDATLINASFLEAIEQGKTDILPQTYVRAFIREYASFVGLDPVGIMKRYDHTQNGPEPPTTDEPPSTVPIAQAELVPPTENSSTSTSRGISVGAKLTLPAILILILFVIVWNLTRTKTPAVIKETPIESIGMDSSSTRGSPVQKTQAPLQHSASTSKDSLTLRAITLDSVWVEIIIDNQAPRQYLFAANRKISWRAKDRFRLNIGNAGLVEISLNDKPLGAPGKKGVVMRNVELNRKTLLQK